MESTGRGRTGRSSLPLIVAGVVLIVGGLGAVAFAATRAMAPAREVKAPVVVKSIDASSAGGVADRAAEVLPPPVAKPIVPSAAVEAIPTSPVPTPRPEPEAAPFDSRRAMGHIRALADIGVRQGGTTGEWRAIVYARDQLKSFGYEVTVQDVPLSNGRTSHNVVAKRPGARGAIVVLGGHIDTKAPSPGADDNGSGVGATLELARDFAQAPPKGDVRFVMFGTEELIGDGNSDHHHYGSRAYVRSLTAEERGRFAAMISIDMIGFGQDFRVRTMGVGTRALADRLLDIGRKQGSPIEYLRDPGKPSGWSDHEPFERAGFPSAWLEWRDNPNAHSSRDTYSRIDERKVRLTGQLVHEWLRSVDERELARLGTRR